MTVAPMSGGGASSAMSTAPEPAVGPAIKESGRGFVVIEAIAHAWGYQRVSASQKVVWCELLTGIGERER